MTLLNIANLVGVSPSTVSRVINNHPRVSPDTAEAVRKAIEQTSFKPRRSNRGRPNGEQGNASIAFLVFGTSGSRTVPAFEHLLRGVSAASTDHQADMVFGFVSDPTELPPKLLQERVDGLLLHGEQPSPAVQARLQSLPTVWLMANRQRPSWGDQVMPDNTVVGELAARYLVRRGHRRLAVLSVNWGGWSMDVRAMSFTRVAQDLGAAVTTLHSPATQPQDFWDSQNLPQLAAEVVERLVRMEPRPTGLFVMEDRQVVAIDAALRRHGLRPGPDGDVELVSCNNERPHLMNLSPIPATIDIRPESIGRRGVELLLSRLNNPSGRDSERVRTMVEPVLVESPA